MDALNEFEKNHEQFQPEHTPIQTVIYIKQQDEKVIENPIQTLSFDAYHDAWKNMATTSPQDIIEKWKAKKKLEQRMKEDKKRVNIERITEKTKLLRMHADRNGTQYIAGLKIDHPVRDNLFSRSDDILEWTKSLNVQSFE